jgi:hypothetical protein
MLLGDRTQHLVPSFYGCQNLMWLFGPLERSWVLVVLYHEEIDGVFEFFDGVEHTAGETPIR